MTAHGNMVATPADDEQLLDQAIAMARHSPNRVRHVGAVLQPSDGGALLRACNTFPRGVADIEARHQGDGRLIWMEHAERNAIFAAARAGRSAAGARLASSYFPCTDCARAIIQAGVCHLVTLPPDLSDPVWGPSFGPSLTMLQEAGVYLSFSPRDATQAQASTMEPPAPVTGAR